VSVPELEALAARALTHARGEAQATALRERSVLSRFARSAPTQATAIDGVEVQVTSVRDGHAATAETTATDDDGLREVAQRAVRAAEAIARGRPGDYSSLPQPAAARGHEGHDPETARLDPAVAGRALAAAFAVAERAGLEAAGIWTAGRVERAIASSTGISVTDAVTDAYMKVICRGPGGRTGFASDAGVAAGAIDAARLAERAAERVTAQAPASLEPGAYPVVLEAEAVGELLAFLGGSAFNGLAFAEERSALCGRLGTRVVAPAINLADTPRFPLTLPRAFDAEGVPKVPIPLIQDGVAHRVVHDTASAAAAGGGARSTGHALVPGGAPDGPAPTNLVLVGGGARDEHELAAPIARGIYVTRFWYVNMVRPRATLVTGMTRDGTFLIEDGVIGRPLRDVRFTDSILRILGATTGLGARPRLVCEGDFYGTRFAHGVVCPPLRAEGFRVTGSTL